MMTIEELKTLVRDVPDFPQKGILFKDITTMLKDSEGLRLAAKLLSEKYADKGITKVVGIESRGFIMGPIVAEKIGAGFVPMRKPGKLPADTVSESYTKEYGVDTIEVHTDALNENDVVLLHDDLLATGGTMYAAYLLAKRFNPKKIYISFIAELEFLKGRELFPADVEIDALIKY
jgi:adenine phosphoribosyltransferase